MIAAWMNRDSASTHDDRRTRKRLPKIVVGGIMKNMMSQPNYLHYFLPKLVQLMQRISYDFHIVVYENDSKDGTREVLLQYLGNTPYATLLLQDAAPGASGSDSHGLLSVERTNRIAGSRNHVLHYVRTSPLLQQKNLDYLYMMDMDGVCAGPNMTLSYDPDIFKYALLDLRDQWDGIFFRFQPYYDLWALRIPNLMPYSFWSNKKSANRIQGPDDLGPILEALAWPSGMLEVDSAFEMTGIYRMDMIRKTTAQYSGHSLDNPADRGAADCEHVAFNKGLRSQFNARLRLSRLVYCQGDDRYEPLPANITQRWNEYDSYQDWHEPIPIETPTRPLPPPVSAHKASEVFRNVLHITSPAS